MVSRTPDTRLSFPYGIRYDDSGLYGVGYPNDFGIEIPSTTASHLRRSRNLPARGLARDLQGQLLLEGWVLHVGENGDL